MQQSLPWWRSDEYDTDMAVPAAFTNAAGPLGTALVRAWPDGRTDPGWGLESPSTGRAFMERYTANEFAANKVLRGYNKGLHGFAFVMRSVNLVCVDIDGKNGGFDHAKKLGALPLTLAEVSKSGNGYHLFYATTQKWDDDLGFGELGDRIGIEQGVDIRATGCVYHWPSQRWNWRAPAMLPAYLEEELLNRQQKITATHARISGVVAAGDTLEVLIMQDTLLDELKKPILPGKRNNTLFAIGQQLKMAQVPDWQEALSARALDVGLDQDEVEKLVANIERYN